MKDNWFLGKKAIDDFQFNKFIKSFICLHKSNFGLVLNGKQESHHHVSYSLIFLVIKCSSYFPFYFYFQSGARFSVYIIQYTPITSNSYLDL